MEIILKNLNAGYFINKKEYSIVIENLNIVFESGKIQKKMRWYLTASFH